MTPRAGTAIVDRGILNPDGRFAAAPTDTSEELIRVPNDLVDPVANLEVLVDEIDRDPTGIFWG